jgi:hypothetical protein
MDRRDDMKPLTRDGVAFELGMSLWSDQGTYEWKTSPSAHTLELLDIGGGGSSWCVLEDCEPSLYISQFFSSRLAYLKSQLEGLDIGMAFILSRRSVLLSEIAKEEDA